jgi:hypothetical protein
MPIKLLQKFSLFLFLLIINSCITEFVPVIDEEKERLVVEGLITDQPQTNTVKLSKSLPLGKKSEARPMTGCMVRILDDLGNSYILEENEAGRYVTDSTVFRGVAGRSYTLSIATNNDNNYLHYVSYSVRMKPASKIDSLYYEKLVIKEPIGLNKGIEECLISLDTYDPDKNSRYYRWDYSETWKFRLPFDIPNQTCWISNNSRSIYLGSTAALSEDRIKHHPVTYISKVTDRLKTKYSILVNQYSLNEAEYNYWDKLQKITVQVGGLYDIIPASVPGNIMCVENPGEKVLGYFSVSAVSSRRIFIHDNFEGLIDDYADCVSDTLLDGPEVIEGLGINVWTLFDIKPSPFSGKPRVRILTERKGCADCTLRGTTKKPDFWEDDK